MTELDERPVMTADLPDSPVPGLEPLLTLDQLSRWTGYSRSHINNCRRRSQHALPTLGTEQRPRFLPSQVLAWMGDEYSRTTTKP